jgi:protein phosphatase
MMLRAAASTDVGLRRRINEDRYALAPDLGLYLVADGMGGHTAGQVASELAADAALQALRALEDASASLAEKLRYAVASANRAIYTTARERPELAGMGTTLVCLLAGEGRAALAPGGDSRAYLVRGDRIRQLTDDHSIVGELLRRHQISEDAAREHPHRHVLTRALGVRRAVEPDLAELTPQPGDRFVLCSDGTGSPTTSRTTRSRRRWARKRTPRKPASASSTSPTAAAAKTTRRSSSCSARRTDGGAPGFVTAQA